METHAQRSNIFVSAGFGLVCVVLLIIAYTSFGGSVPLAPQGYRFTVPLPNAGNLAAGSEVDIAGVKVGRVESVGVSGGHAIASVELQTAYAPLRTDARAIVRTKTLAGETYLELAPGANNGPVLADGAQLPPRQVSPSVTVDDFLKTFNPATRQQMRQMFAGLASAFGGRAQELNNALGEASPVAGNLATVLQTLDGETIQLQGLFNDSGIVLAALGARRGDLRAAVTAADRVLDATARRNQALMQTVRALPRFLGQLSSTARTLTSDSPDLQRAVGALLPAAAVLPQSLQDFDKYLPQYRSLFNALPATVAAAQRGLPALTRILRAVPGPFRSFYDTARQLIPIVQLFAAYREEAIIGPLANTSSVMNRTLVGQGGFIVHPGAGAFFFSNESLAGWTKRLPTNRENPYPTPDGLGLLAKIGYLKSYDCRHIHNPQLLPPTGTGVPPCVEQGPWTYRGKTARYPRLSPAPP